MNDQGHRDTTPDWFKRAIAAPYDSRFVDVAGCRIHYLRWGNPDRPGLVLIPGTGGHAHWFTHVAPLFADQFHVVAMDFGGNGDSGRRPAYSLELLTEEIIGVCADSGMLSASVPPTIVGHSMGGQFAVRAAIARGDAFLGVIAVDGLRYAALTKDPAVDAFKSLPATPRPHRIYPDYESAVARFRLQPEPEIEIEATYVLDHIARHSVRQVEEGWTWKYDGAFMSVMTLGLDLKDKLKGLPCRAATIYGETSHIVDDGVLEKMAEATGGEVSVFIIPGTSHYPMIDSPLAFVAAVKGTTLAWIADAKRKRSEPA